MMTMNGAHSVLVGQHRERYKQLGSGRMIYSGMYGSRMHDGGDAIELGNLCVLLLVVSHGKWTFYNGGK